jgi:ribulose-5-phosphate 4-epimerase/fuculose-1-phosphate aldolase
MNRRTFLASIPAFASMPAAFVGAQRSLAQSSPPSATLINDLVTANHILSNEGIVDGYGHVSVRHNANPNRFLLARSMAPALVRAEDIFEYDLDGKPVNGAPSSYLERFIHSEIYRARPDVNSVVHDHSPAVIPFGISKVPLRPVYHMAHFVGEGVPVFEIREVAPQSNMLVNDQARGRALAAVLGNRPAVLLRGHGAAIVGPTLLIAVARAVYLDMDARLQAQALGLGGPLTYLSPEESKMGTQDYERSWALWKLKVAESGK